jgi:Activator of Hsp90 ATPase homolog 1-like protein
MKITVETNVAPIEQVWSAYKTPEYIKKWNAASDDWHTTAASVDLREGGKFSSHMEAKDGSMGFDFALHMSPCGPSLPTWTVQQVGSYLRYTGRDANVVQTAARDPERSSPAIMRRWVFASAPHPMLPSSSADREVGRQRIIHDTGDGSVRHCAASSGSFMPRAVMR